MPFSIPPNPLTIGGMGLSFAEFPLVDLDPVDEFEPILNAARGLVS
jgi:hypothetical protein